MFTLPKLAYDYDALGTYISKDIMLLHHDKHHQTYVDKLNAALEAEPSLQNKTIIELITDLDTVPEQVRAAVRNHGGGHYNHSQFWQWMSPNGGGNAPGALGDAITQKYGGFQQFVDEFSAKALTVFGSGWVWLMPDLSIITTPNQDSPVNAGLPEPILGLDVWEHAYYLDYTYNRGDYVKAWWNVVDWQEVSRRFDASR